MIPAHSHRFWSRLVQWSTVGLALAFRLSVRSVTPSAEMCQTGLGAPMQRIGFVVSPGFQVVGAIVVFFCRT